MDEPSRQRRHNDPLGQHALSTRLGSQPSRSVPSGGNDRYRPAPINTSPHTPRSIGGGSGNYSGYYQEPTSAVSSTSIPPGDLTGYGSDYNQDGRQHSQSFGGYNTTAMMYNVAQSNTQTSVYDGHQFGSRQPAAMQMITPDVTSTYFGTDAANASASSLNPPAHNSGSSTSLYQQNPSINYTSNMPSAGTMQQQVQGSADVSMNEEDAENSDGALEEKWHNYQRQLATIFQDIANGLLDSASETLLTISNWLLSQVSDLGKCKVRACCGGFGESRNRPGAGHPRTDVNGRSADVNPPLLAGLVLDDASLHADRIKLWDDFNHAWLALGQRQVDLMQSGQKSHRLLSQDTIEKLGNEIVRLSDGLERHGLVDYQYGVWEDQIVAGMLALSAVSPSLRHVAHG